MMQTSLRPCVLSASLVAMAALVAMPTAGAMGWSPTPSVRAPESVSQIGAMEQATNQVLQTQIEALRQEVADLKARVERQDVAAAD